MCIIINIEKNIYQKKFRNLYQKLHKISLNRGRSYIDFKQLKNKKGTINPKNKDNRCLQYAVIAAFYNQENGKNPKRISKLRPCISNIDWEGIEFPSHVNDWIRFKKNNKSIALNVLYVP